MHRFPLLLAWLILAGACASANNLQITGISLTGQNTASNYTMVEFNISWEHSWRDNSNWDAAWLFIKWSTDKGLTWKHGTLNATAANHLAPGGSTITPAADGTGVFLHRSASGSGTASWTDVQLRWEYGLDGIADNATMMVKVFGIEMVYVPQGSFWVGDGSMYSIAGVLASAPGYQAPFQITSEGALTLGGTATGNLASRYHLSQSGSSDDDFDSTTTKTLPAAFPKGYNAFYCMKHEVTQDLYKDFLNTLTRAQQATNVYAIVLLNASPVNYRYVMTGSHVMAYRNSIRCDSLLPPLSIPVTFYCDYDGDGIGNESNDGQNIALNWVPHYKLNNVADWAALRPMTELEYEKACRGDILPLADECPWGSLRIDSLTALTNAGSGTEADAGTTANCVYGAGYTLGPARAGIFATAGSTQEQAGASYWGILDLAGNLHEYCVSIGNSTHRSFTGLHGDGVLNATGNANVAGLPGLSGYRGGGYSHVPEFCRISDRYYANYNVGGGSNFGGRLVRTAP